MKNELTELKTTLDLEKLLKLETHADKEVILGLYKEMVYSLQDDARSKPISKKVIDNPLITSIYNSLDTAGYLI